MHGIRFPSYSYWFQGLEVESVELCSRDNATPFAAVDNVRSG